ncbi:hypothetical protein Q5752_000567 [Cryptotrichosporon argae]
MSTSQITPRKRKVSAASPSTQSKVSNPPVVPYPTPSSRKRRLPVSSPPPELEAPSAKRPTCRALPDHLQTLLTLQHAFNLALSLHIATHPPVLPPHAADTTVLALPNVANFLALRESVERTSGRRFDLTALQRLAYVWTWDGEAGPGAGAGASGAGGAESENPFVERPAGRELRGMGYVLTPTRTLDPHTGRKTQTYGLGIELGLVAGETRAVLVGGADGGLSNRGQGGGARAVGRWSAAGEAREGAFREKLERWVDAHGGWEPAQQALGLPTPTTRSNERSTIPPIPLAPLPKLPTSVSAANLFSPGLGPGSGASAALAALTSGQGLTSLPPRFAKPVSAPLGLDDPFELKPGPSKEAATPVKPGDSLEARRQALAARIKARQDSSRAAGTTLGAAVAGGIKGLSAAAQQEELKRRSTLSRLEGVAEAVWMLFSAPASSAGSLTSPRVRRKAMLMTDVADMVVKSSKTPISSAEAQTSLLLLTQLCPFFLVSKSVGRQDWLEMPPALAAPPSPGGADASAAPGSLAGPASPGRVRRTGGLREVRERIRRELGE